MIFLVKILKGQRSKVNELCQNWLKIEPNLTFFTLNAKLMVQCEPNMVQRLSLYGGRLVKVCVKFLKGQRSVNFTPRLANFKQT